MANEEIRKHNMERVLEASYKLILKHGIENTTKEMLSRASSVSRSTLDRFFENKLDCIVKTAEWTARRLTERILPLEEMLSSGKHNGRELLTAYLHNQQKLYYEQKELFIAIAELRLFIGRNSADGSQTFERLCALLGFRPMLCKILARGKADGSLLPSINETEEAVYINGFYRELMINLALTKNLSAEEEARMLTGFIERMLRYYSVPNDTYN